MYSNPFIIVILLYRFNRRSIFLRQWASLFSSLNCLKQFFILITLLLKRTPIVAVYWSQFEVLSSLKFVLLNKFQNCNSPFNIQFTFSSFFFISTEQIEFAHTVDNGATAYWSWATESHNFLHKTLQKTNFSWALLSCCTKQNWRKKISHSIQNEKSSP